MAVVVSSGQLVQIGGAPVRPRRTLDLYGLRLSYAKIFETQPAVRTCVAFIARNIAQLGLHAFERLDDDDRQRIRSGPLAQVIRKPNPMLVHYGWIYGVFCDLGIYDEHTSIKIRDRKTGNLTLWPVPVEMVEVVGTNWMAPEGYRIGGSNGPVLDPSQVFHINGYHPNSRWNGCSPLEALRRILAGDNAAEEYREAFWRNGAQVSGIISRPADAPAWTDGAKQKFLDQWAERYGLGGQGAGGTPLLEDGMTFEQAGSTLKDAQYLEGRQFTREEVAAEYFIPPPMVGLLDKANYSSTTEFHKMLYQDCLGPAITHFEEEYNDQVVSEVADPATTYVELNWMEKLAGSFEEQLRILSMAVGAPIMTVNEGRAKLNLPRSTDPGADELIVPMNVTQGGQANPLTPTEVPQPKALPPAPAKARRPRPIRATTVPDHLDLITKTLTATFERQQGVVLSRLGAKNAKAALADVFNQERFDRELAADLHTASLTIAEETAAHVLTSAGKDPAEATAEPMSKYLREKAKAQAQSTNADTAARIADDLDADDPTEAVKATFAGRIGTAVTLATGLAAAVTGFAASDTAKAVGYGQKTWIVNSAKSRHPELDGETVGIDDTFSNGARWPGDSDAGADESAGCTCDMEITHGGD